MIEITLYWWMAPVSFVVVGFGIAWLIFSKPTGDYDFSTPLLGYAAALLGICSALGFLVGWVLA